MIVTSKKEAVHQDFITYCQRHKGKTLYTKGHNKPFTFDILANGFEYLPSESITQIERVHSFDFIKKTIFSNKLKHTHIYVFLLMSIALVTPSYLRTIYLYLLGQNEK
jgi:hypothetical protein